MHLFKVILEKFDRFLDERNLSFEGVLVGGAALQLLGVTQRTTKDCDVLSPQISAEVSEAAIQFAEKEGLYKNWFNNGPASLIRDLPFGWDQTLVLVFAGKRLKLYSLSRLDLLRSKLFAFVDRGIDLDDLLHLKPSIEEINSLLAWLKDRDGNPDWPTYVDLQLAELIRRLHGGR